LLTQLTAHWFDVLTERIPGLKTHFSTLQLPSLIAYSDEAFKLKKRSMQVRRLKVFPIESIVRGYITGSAWNEYKKSGTVHGITIAPGLVESQQFPEPCWTPSTKAEAGEHDENISPQKGGKPFASL